MLRRPVTGRALVLGAVVVLLVVLLAAPVHRYLAARSNLHQAQAQAQQSQQQLDRLKAEQKQLGEPAYIEQQARVRLHFALPGETVYTVVGPDGGSLQDAPAPTSVPQKPPGQTWNQRLWGSVQAADHSP